MPGEEITETHFRFGRQQLVAETVEAQDVEQHPVVSRAQQVAALGKDRIELGVAAIFEAGICAAKAETHVGRLVRDAQRAQQRGEMRVIAFVEHQKAGVHGQMLPVHRHIDRMAVAAGPAVCLEDGQIAVPGQLMGGIQTGNTAADDRYSHVYPPEGLWFHILCFVAAWPLDAVWLNQFCVLRRIAVAGHCESDGGMPDVCCSNRLQLAPQRLRGFLLLLTGVLAACGRAPVSLQELNASYERALERSAPLAVVHEPGSDAQQAAFDRLQTYFTNMSAASVREQTAQVYAPEAYLNDTLVGIDGVARIEAYFGHTMQDTRVLNVRFIDKAQAGIDYFVRWEMTVEHGSLAGGEPILSYGVTQFPFRQRGARAAAQGFLGCRNRALRAVAGAGSCGAPRARRC